MVAVFTRKMLFLHVPKAGGTSAAQYLLSTLPRPVHYVHKSTLRHFVGPGVEHILGDGHIGLDDAAIILEQKGIDIEALPMILAVLRNPYDLAVSLFAWFGRPGVAKDAQGLMHPLRKVALTGSFTDFVVAAANYRSDPLRSAWDAFHLQGAMPPNLRMVRFERLEADIKAALINIDVTSDRPFPFRNTSQHRDFRTYYDPASEAIVFGKNHWMFAQGYFERIQIDQHGHRERDEA